MISHEHRSTRGRRSSSLLSAACLALALALVGAAGAACGGPTGAAAVEYSVSAQKNYEKGMERLKAEDWIAAAKYFAFIKSRFPYSKYAVLAQIRIADAEFGAEQYIEAIDGYKVFAKFHPTHELVVNGYASFRVGESYYKQLPGDFWLIPPSHEKDQSSTEDAAEELQRFLDKYPDSPYRNQARKLLDRVGRRLAAHEWYVAQYYWKRDKPMGTVLRLRRLLDHYGGVGYDEDALWLLGKAYAAVSLPDRARTTWQELVDKYPKSEHAADARAAIGQLPAAKEAPPKDQAPVAPAAPAKDDTETAPAPAVPEPSAEPGALPPAPEPSGATPPPN